MSERGSSKPTIGADLFTTVRDLAEDSVAPAPVAAEQIAGYELVFRLASGGMADVYLARDGKGLSSDGVVAIKRVHRHFVGKAGYREMFLDEARIAFQITHPNVCAVLDFGESNGEYYLAMEYLTGEPLARLMNRVANDTELDPGAPVACRVARMMADACNGLHAAHNVRDSRGALLGVVHRDVTPRNLFLTYDGRVKVLDFGIATAAMRLHAKQSGELRGNLAYMAPEQLTGHTVDRRADIWALGVTFWEMLAMRRLFKRGAPMETVQAVMYDTIPPPSEVVSGIPRGLDDIVLRALERDPSFRWQTAEEMRQAIEAVLGGQSVAVGPAQLSAWMAHVFPFGEAHKSQLVRAARLGSKGAARALSGGDR